MKEVDNSDAQKKDQKKSVEAKFYGRDGAKATLELSNPSELGKGAFGKTFKTYVYIKDGDTSRLRESVLPFKEGEEAAVKVCSDDNPIERDLLLKLKHPNIIGLMFHNIFEKKMYMVLELMDAQDLYELVLQTSKKKRGLGIYVKLYGYQIFRGLAYCDSVGIMHRDIKSENVLIDHNRGILKIADFGCGALYTDTRKYQPYVGTREFRAPEQLMGSEIYSTKIDIWGGAIVLSEMILFHPIFQARIDSVQLLHKIMAFLGSPSDEICKEIQVDNLWPFVKPTETLRSLFKSADPSPPDTQLLFPLLKDILVYSPKKRLKAWDIVAHQFFDELFQHHIRLPNGGPLPPIRNFAEKEIKSMTELARTKLVRS